MIKSLNQQLEEKKTEIINLRKNHELSSFEDQNSIIDNRNTFAIQDMESNLNSIKDKQDQYDKEVQFTLQQIKGKAAIKSDPMQLNIPKGLPPRKPSNEIKMNTFVEEEKKEASDSDVPNAYDSDENLDGQVIDLDSDSSAEEITPAKKKKKFNQQPDMEVIGEDDQQASESDESDTNVVEDAEDNNESNKKSDVMMDPQEEQTPYGDEEDN